MAQESLIVTLGVEDKNASTQIKAFNKELKSLDTQYKASSKGADGFDKSLSGLSTKLNLLEQKFTVQKSKLDAYNQQLNKAKDGVSKKTAELEKLKKSQDSSSDAIAKTEKQLASYKSQLHNAENAIKLTETEMSNLTDEINNTKVAISNFNVNKLKEELDQTSKKLQNAGKNIENIGNTISGIGDKLTLGLTMPIIAAGVGVAKLGSDMEENVNKIDATFQNNAEEIKAWCKTTLDQYGIASVSAMEYAAKVGDILKGIGFDDSQLVGLSETIISMSSDIASFKNSNPEEVFNAITAALTGEREQLKKYGYVINDAILEQYALSQGYEKSYKEMTLQEKALLTLSKIQEYSKDATGDFAKTQDSAANQAKIFKESLKELGTTFGQDILPMVTPVIKKANELIKGFSELDEESRKNVISTALFAAGLGPMMKILGTTTTGIGKTVTGIGKLTGKLGELTLKTKGVTTATGALATATTSGASSLGILASVVGPLALGVGAVGTAIYAANEANDMWNGSIIKSTDEMSFLEKAFGNLAGVTMYSKEELENMGAVYKDWNSNVSPETQKELDNMAEKFRDLQFNMDLVNLDGVISQAEVDELVKRTEEMCSNIIKAINNHNDPAYQAMYDLFMQDGAIDEAEKAMLDTLNKGMEEQIATVEEGKNRINEIYQTASTEGREITETEQKEIADIQQKWQDIALENLTLSQAERESAIKEFNQRCKAENTEGLSEIVKEEVKSYDESKQALIDKYESQIATMKEQLPNLEGVQKEEVEARIKQYEDAYALELENEATLYQDKISLLNEKYPEMMNFIDKYNGDILSKGDVRCKEEFEKMKSHYLNINKVTEDGLYRMYNTTTNSYDDVLVKVDEVTGEVVGLSKVWQDGEYLKADKTTGYNKQIIESVAGMRASYVADTNTILYALRSQKDGTINANGEIVLSNGKVVGSLKDIKESADGTRTGILDLNGTPCTVQVNKDGAVTNLDDITWRLNNLHGKTFTSYVAVQSYAVGGGFSQNSYEEGGYISSPEVAYTNEKHSGFELIEGNATELASDSFGSITALGAGSRVYNNTASIAMMKEEISNQLGKVGFGDYYNMNTAKSNPFSKNIIPNYSNNNSNLENLMSDMINLLKVISMKDNNLYLDSKQIAKATARPMNRELGFQSKKGW
ncbi:MAG: phage tail tape measure protein [Cetobacterium sp.]